MAYKRISVAEAKILMQSKDVEIVDIRDDVSYEAGHVPNAKHVTIQHAAEFCETADKNKPILVYCYHGNSSQLAAEYLDAEGFTEVYSLDGGFAAWPQK